MMEGMIITEVKKFLLQLKEALKDKEIRSAIVEIGKEVKEIVKEIGGAK